MPSTYENFAVSFDGDSRRDLWNSLNDVFASTANYLEKSGWQKGQSWGVEVKLPDNMNWELADPSKWLVLAEWEKIGITRIDGHILKRADKKEARLFLPAGYKGPVFLVFRNFLAIKKYNNSDSYALAVAHLGDRIRNGKKIITQWPRDDVPLSLNENKDLQSLLTALGYDTGGIDGKIGPNTRQAVRHWQKDKGLPADGYVNKRILELLR
jgi:membrane-bound lytic murein transglycosylase B